MENIKKRALIKHNDKTVGVCLRLTAAHHTKRNNFLKTNDEGILFNILHDDVRAYDVHHDHLAYGWFPFSMTTHLFISIIHS